MGIFRAAGRIELCAELADWTRQWLDDSLDWFNENLPVPQLEEPDRNAIFWFRPQSKVVRETWQLVTILREEGVPVNLRATKTPGRIVYHDPLQIAAIPYGHGRRPRKDYGSSPNLARVHAPINPTVTWVRAVLKKGCQAFAECNSRRTVSSIQAAIVASQLLMPF